MRRSNRDVGFNSNNNNNNANNNNANNRNNANNNSTSRSEVTDRSNLFARDNILRKTSNNMARAEARTNENPLRTENSYELDDDEGENGE